MATASGQPPAAEPSFSQAHYSVPKTKLTRCEFEPARGRQYLLSISNSASSAGESPSSSAGESPEMKPAPQATSASNSSKYEDDLDDDPLSDPLYASILGTSKQASVRAKRDPNHRELKIVCRDEEANEEDNVQLRSLVERCLEIQRVTERSSLLFANNAPEPVLELELEMNSKSKPEPGLGLGKLPIRVGRGDKQPTATNQHSASNNEVEHDSPLSAGAFASQDE